MQTSTRQAQKFLLNSKNLIKPGPLQLFSNASEQQQQG